MQDDADDPGRGSEQSPGMRAGHADQVAHRLQNSLPDAVRHRIVAIQHAEAVAVDTPARDATSMMLTVIPPGFQRRQSVSRPQPEVVDQRREQGLLVDDHGAVRRPRCRRYGR